MDLQDFEGQVMYFDEPLSKEVQALIDASSDGYSEGNAEAPLLKARELAPESLTVMVSLYRFYYYQHRLEDALAISHQVLSQVAPSLGFPQDWEKLTKVDLFNALQVSFTLVRFYLLALKGAAYLNLRLGRQDTAVRMLTQIVDFDTHDRLGAQALLAVVGGCQSEPQQQQQSATA